MSYYVYSFTTYVNRKENPGHKSVILPLRDKRKQKRTRSIDTERKKKKKVEEPVPVPMRRKKEKEWHRRTHTVPYQNTPDPKNAMLPEQKEME